MIKNFLGLLITLSFVFSGGFALAANTTTSAGTPGATQTSPSASTGAGGTGTTVNTKLQNPIKYDKLSDFVAAVLKAAVEVLMPFVVLAFIWSGFLFVRAQGNEEQLSEAKTAIYWSVIGAFILLSAWGFAQIIARTVSTITNI